jgi:hypothetical protein
MDWKKLKKHISPSFLLLVSVLFLFSTWLMFHTFSYNSPTHSILIASRLWSDFGASIPLIRSFSLGANWPPQYPIFPGPPIRYHFLFFLLVGLLERLGVRIDVALNIPSSVGLTLLLTMLFVLAKKVFKDYRIGLLAILFFLFNGSLAFVRFFTLHPLSAHSIADIVKNNEFPAFAPWGPGDITAFWNLNIYTNQRHLALAFGIALLFMYFCQLISSKPWKNQLPWALLWGIILGAFPFFHQPTLLMLGIVCIVYFLFYSKLRIFLATVAWVSLMLIIPQLSTLRGGAKISLWYPGYLIHDELSPLRFISYWWQNMGLHILFIPIGFLLAPKNAKKALVPLFIIFIVANLFRFSVEVAGGHKFFNFVLILGDMLTAYTLVYATTIIRHVKFLLIRVLAYGNIACIIIGLTLSGIIDFFPIVNDTKGSVSDIPASEVATWISTHTSPNAIFLNSSYFYHPASLAGRSIFFGWPYFSWSAGYTEDRLPILKRAYESKDPAIFCPILTSRHIDFVTVENTHGDPNLPDIDTNYFYSHFAPVYTNGAKTYGIFSTASLCKIP